MTSIHSFPTLTKPMPAFSRKHPEPALALLWTVHYSFFFQRTVRDFKARRRQYSALLQLVSTKHRQMERYSQFCSWSYQCVTRLFTGRSTVITVKCVVRLCCYDSDHGTVSARERFTFASQPRTRKVDRNVHVCTSHSNSARAIKRSR